MQDTFESKDGTVFQSPPGIQPERDKKGELAYRAVSYTPWPVEEGAEGDRLRVNVGPLGRQQKQTYVFERSALQYAQGLFRRFILSGIQYMR